MWGALGAAFLASAMNDALSVWVDAVAGEEGARAFVPALGGPIVEEVTKAAGLVAILLLAPGALAGLVDGIVCGALVGLGFTMTENIRYLTLAALQGGSAGLDRALWVRRGARRVHARRVHRNGGSRSGLDPRAAAAAGTVAVGTRGGARRGHPPSTCSGTPSPPARSPRRSAIPPVPEGPAAMRRSRRRSS